RQDLTKTADVHHPRTRLRQRLLVFLADAIFCHLMRIALPATAALVTESPDIIPFIPIHIPEPWDIDAIRAAAIIVFILIAFHETAGAHTQMMIHEVMPQLTAAAAQTIGPY